MGTVSPRALVLLALALLSSSSAYGLALADIPPAVAQPTAGRAWLGISMDRDSLSPGALVGHVVRGSPADRAGIRDGDRLVGVAGARVGSSRAVVEAVAAHQVGDRIDITYVRDGREARASAVLGRYPPPEEVMRMDLVGAFAPAWSNVQPISGAFPPSPSDLRGRVVLLDFWATWCAPCRIVAPRLSALQERYGAQGLTVLGVSAEEADEIQAFVRRLPMRYAVGVDKAAETARRYGVTSLPTLVVVDRRGVVREVFVGYDPAAESRLGSTIQALLAEAVAPP
jgi:thiol-disulfide isomerase/thioredoxin